MNFNLKLKEFNSTFNDPLTAADTLRLSTLTRPGDAVGHPGWHSDTVPVPVTPGRLARALKRLTLALAVHFQVSICTILYGSIQVSTVYQVASECGSVVCVCACVCVA